ncbi:MAG: NHL repeat-containing protein, partial [Actinomycetota bacterium]
MRRSPRLSALVLTVVTVGAVLLPAGTASAAVTYAGTLAGPSIAATYPSGLEYDDVNGRLVVADTGLDRIEFYTYNVSAGTYLKTGQFGSHGTGDGQFDSPRDVAIDDVGNIYVGDAANNRVQSFTSGGAFRWQKGGTGSCNDCLNTPIGVTWDAQNDVLLVASTGQDLIKAFDSAGTYQWRSPTAATIGIDAPRDVARGPDGRIWIADYAHHQVKAFNVSANGATWTNTPEIVLGDGVAGGGGNGQVNFPYNMDFSLDGQTVYVSDTGNNRVVRWDLSTPTPTWLGPAIGGDCPQSPNPCLDPPADFGTIDTLRRVVVDPAGRLVTADFWGNGMQVFDGTTGSMLLQMELASAPAPGFAQAFGVATGSTGLVYAVDRLNQRLEHFNAAGGFIRAAGSRGTANGRFSWPEAVAVDPVSGVVWAADTRGDRIQRWAAGITPLSTQSEGTSGTGVGQFNYIEDLDVAPDGDVYVADTRNDRIQIYDPPTDSFSVFPAAPTGGAMNDPQGVVATATSVFVADTGTNRILRFSRTSGAQQAVFSTGLAGPQGIAVDDADGTVWVADTGNNRILHLSADLVDLGHTFGSAGTGNLQFDLPHTLDVTGDRLYVTDTFNDRITYFDISSLGGGGPDTTPPTTTVAVPANAQVFTALPVAMSGTASDNVGVQKVEVGIQDRVSKLWYRSNATWGAYQKQLATLASP